MTWERKFKAIEDDWNDKIDPGNYVVIRVDGRAFSKLTRKLDQPFSVPFMEWMDKAAVQLCYEMQGAVFAYVQSDEISVLLSDFGSDKRGRWFDWNVNKLVSVSAGIAGGAFNVGFMHDLNGTLWQDQRPAVFDARVVPMKDRLDVIQYFLWRQRDAYINSISMIADKLCGSASLMNVDLNGRIDMLFKKGIMVNDLPLGLRQGRVVTAKKALSVVEYTHKKTGEVQRTEVMRNNWAADNAPWFDWDNAGFLEYSIPHPIKECRLPACGCDGNAHA